MAGLLGHDTLFSAVSGEVTQGGAPVAGATIEQRVQQGSTEAIINSLTTAADGAFSFVEITKKRGFASLIPHEFVAAQSLTITYEGKEYIGWSLSKREPESGVETGGKEFKLICDLTIEPDFEGKHYGVCRLVNN